MRRSPSARSIEDTARRRSGRPCSSSCGRATAPGSCAAARSDRPSYLESRRALREHMPELVPTWEQAGRAGRRRRCRSAFPVAVVPAAVHRRLLAGGVDRPARRTTSRCCCATTTSRRGLLEGSWLATRWTRPARRRAGRLHLGRARRHQRSRAGRVAVVRRPHRVGHRLRHPAGAALRARGRAEHRRGGGACCERVPVQHVLHRHAARRRRPTGRRSSSRPTGRPRSRDARSVDQLPAPGRMAAACRRATHVGRAAASACSAQIDGRHGRGRGHRRAAAAAAVPERLAARLRHAVQRAVLARSRRGRAVLARPALGADRWRTSPPGSATSSTSPTTPGRPPPGAAKTASGRAVRPGAAGRRGRRAAATRPRPPPAPSR